MITVRFFASLREDVGCETVSVDAASLRAANLEALLTALAANLGQNVRAVLAAENVRIAVNQELVDGEVVLGPDDEVAFLPPVTGG